MSNKKEHKSFKESIKQPSLMASINMKKIEQQSEQFAKNNGKNILGQCKYNSDTDVER